MSKTYLVTGGAGFIGSNFIHYLLKKHQDILIVNVDKLTYAGNLENLKSVMNDKRHVFVQADICDAQAMQKLFELYTIDYVVNFAAESHVDRSITDPDVFVRTNVMGTLNLLNIAKANWTMGDDAYREGVKFQQVSTDEVYGSLGPEGFFTETTPLDPHSPYSASKTSADLFVKAYADTYKLPVTITRCSNNYGPYQFPEKLIPLMINNCLNKQSLPVYGDGMQIRDWLYVEDHCKAIDLVLQKGRAGEVYNVGGHNEQPNIAIVRSIIAYVGEKVDPSIDESLIRHVTDRKGHDRRYGIDPSKIREELGWEPETMFAEGIGKTIDWYLGNRQWMEHVTSGSYQNYYQEMYANR
ncbi:dTDP-glucose 4,6-dehydratase [Sphaerochaeta globosa]|uniref:dTDP-glucose 4,6-dehydratase n=1 Tax=Sphaerochaeta globosa (strain ATCC BAA-1886 / DSM 22777 / Buddy) TaxID=158189 RepID=F0RXU0_SPHGB|nr:dTDP-glucose 4,6-dehydratase [Sphaerochaeta globosa]ADY12217.1 dTDP-glucose 4,6-dehydratase [Sphaerochaeta globosa str. Buddy]